MTEIATIGIVPLKSVVSHGIFTEAVHVPLFPTLQILIFLQEPGSIIEYSTQEQYNGNWQFPLNPNHTHYVLVDSKYDDRKVSIKERNWFCDWLEVKLHREFSVPLVYIVAQGDGNTLETIAHGTNLSSE